MADFLVPEAQQSIIAKNIVLFVYAEYATWNSATKVILHSCNESNLKRSSGHGKVKCQPTHVIQNLFWLSDKLV